jgi:hypothetical protein
MRATQRLLVLVLLGQGLSGCATILNGTRQSVHFDSTPEGAVAKVDGQTVRTPGQLSLRRKYTYDVRFEKPGYVPARRHIGQRTSAAWAGNLLLGGGLGVIVDIHSGAMYDLYPSSVSAMLVPDPLSVTGGAPADIGAVETPQRPSDSHAP